MIKFDLFIGIDLRSWMILKINKMFHAHTSGKYDPVSEKELLDAIIIPCEERND